MATAPLPARDIIRAALDYAKELLVPPPEELAVEEFEQSDDGRHWLVTIGFWRPKPKTPLDKEIAKQSRGVGLVLDVPSAQVERVYKLVKVDAATGNAVSMKNHDV